MVGAFHWTRNCGTVKAGMNGTKIYREKSQKINFANVSLNCKFWEQNQIKWKFLATTFRKFGHSFVTLSFQKIVSITTRNFWKLKQEV